MPSGAETQFEFGQLRLIPARRLLCADDRPVAIHGRTFDLLVVLVEHRDRIVGRDELLARVWAGATVADGNIAVQVAALRRILDAHAVDPKAIVNVPGRGYQFVAEVRETGPASEDAIAVAPERTGRRFPSWAITVAAAACATLGVAAAAGRFIPMSQPGQDPRLTVEFTDFVAREPANKKMAAEYADDFSTVENHYADNTGEGDVRLVKTADASRRTPFHFRLGGTLHQTGPAFQLRFVLTCSDGTPISVGYVDHPSAPSADQILTDAGTIADEIADPVFATENKMRKGAPRDALDFYIQAQVDCLLACRPDETDKAIGDLRHAIAPQPMLFSAGLYLVSLLNDRLQLSPVQKGDGDGIEAIALEDELLTSQRRNTVAIVMKASTLVKLGKPEDAVTLLLPLLTGGPRNQGYVRSVLLDAYVEGEHFPEADALVRNSDFAPGSQNVAALEFAEDRDAASLVVLRDCLATTNRDIDKSLMELLQVAALQELGRAASAQEVFRAIQVPSTFPHWTVSSLRRGYYELPPNAWERFTRALRSAGMAS